VNSNEPTPTTADSVDGERSAITNAAPELPAEPSYAMALATQSYHWYQQHAVSSRRAYKCLETALLIVAAAIPTSAAITPHNVIVPAVLGAVVVILSGLRSVFHWQDNYLRFSGAREAVEAERRLYKTGAAPYADETSKDQILAAAVSRIEQQEMAGWVKVAAARPKP
jgi:hypothetical protein